MIVEIKFKSGEEGVNRREFELKAYHMEPAPDTIAPLLIHLTDMLANLHPGDLMEVLPMHVPELAKAEMARRSDTP
jgi:hypothetical protein